MLVIYKDLTEECIDEMDVYVVRKWFANELIVCLVVVVRIVMIVKDLECVLKL